MVIVEGEISEVNRNYYRVLYFGCLKLREEIGIEPILDTVPPSMYCPWCMSKKIINCVNCSSSYKDSFGTLGILLLSAEIANFSTLAGPLDFIIGCKKSSI